MAESLRRALGWLLCVVVGHDWKWLQDEQNVRYWECKRCHILDRGTFI